MSQEALVTELRNEIAKGRAVIVAGTGVSVTATADQKIDGYSVARWDGLLLHGVDHCLRGQQVLLPEEAEVLRGQIKLGTPDFVVAAAELISSRLRSRSPGIYHRWLRDTVGCLKATKPEILKALAQLDGVLATLNYDRTFEDVTGRHPVTWQERNRVEEILRDSSHDAVLHLHGYFEAPDSVVLGLGSYAKVVSDPHTSTILQLFALDRTLIFVGCGGTLKDPNFSRLLEWAQAALKDSTHRHFRLCHQEEFETVRAERQTTPWLHPVVYGTAYDGLVPFLTSLAPPSGHKLKAIPRSPLGAEHGLNLNGYRQAMRKRYGRVKLEELDSTTYDVRPITLTGSFIAQSVRECAEFFHQLFELPKELQQRLREAGDLEKSGIDNETIDRVRPWRLPSRSTAAFSTAFRPRLLSKFPTACGPCRT